MTMFTIFGLITYVLFAIVAGAGLVAAGQIAFTRDDAFTAADRQPKWAWFAIAAGATLALFSGVMILQVIGAVIIGIYYFDVRPQIKDLLSGNYY